MLACHAWCEGRARNRLLKVVQCSHLLASTLLAFLINLFGWSMRGAEKECCYVC